MKRPIYTHLGVQLLFAIACGVRVAHFHPDTGASLLKSPA